MEKWKPIKGYEGLYEVGDSGIVRRVGGRELRQWTTNWGYKMVQLWKNGEGKHHSVHRLVATAFIPNPCNLPQVNHKDEKKDNNHVFNLEWCTPSENINHGSRNKRVSIARMNNPKTSKPVRQYTPEGDFIAEYPSMQEAGRQSGVGAGSIHYSATKNAVGGGYRWEFV